MFMTRTSLIVRDTGPHGFSTAGRTMENAGAVERQIESLREELRARYSHRKHSRLRPFRSAAHSAEECVTETTAAYLCGVRGSLTHRRQFRRAHRGMTPEASRSPQAHYPPRRPGATSVRLHPEHEIRRIGRASSGCVRALGFPPDARLLPGVYLRMSEHMLTVTRAPCTAVRTKRASLAHGRIEQ